MVRKVRRILDYLRNSGKKIIIRFNSEDVVELLCHCRYDSALEKRVRILKKVEVRNDDGFWEPYPSVSQYWAGGDVGQCYTTALVKLVGEKEITVCSSKNWCPDTQLLESAKEAGIHTETIFHD